MIRIIGIENWRKNRLQRRALAGVAVVAALMLGACAQSSVREAAKATVDAPMLALADRMAVSERHAAAVPLYRDAYRSGAGEAALVGLARALMALGRYDEAERVLQPEVDDSDTGADLHLTMGEINLAFARPAIALEHFEAALTRGGGAEALSGRGIALDALGRHGEALAAHREAVSRGGRDLNLLSNQALSLALHGEAERAVEILEDVAQDDEARAQHRQNLVLAYVFAGDIETARRMASVDLDAESVSATLRYFRELTALPPEARVRSMLFGAQSPQRTVSDVAVLRITENEPSQAAAEKIIRTPEPVAEAKPAPVAQAAPPPEPEPSPEPEPEPEPEPVPADLPPLVDPEGWSVQVAAYRTAEQLLRGRDIYWERYSEILGPLEPRRSEVDFGDREDPPRGFFFRLNAGPLRDFDEAREICERLEAAGGDCWIRPPEPSEGRLPGAADQGL